MAEASEAEGPNGPHVPEPSEPETQARQAVDAGSGPRASVNGGEGRAGDATPAASEVTSSPDEPSGAQGGDAAAAADEGESAEVGAESEEATGGEPGAKRKRRRRRKRKGESETGDREAPAGAPESRDNRPKRRDVSNAPFLRFFSGGQGARKHGFAVGEVVAGRVRSTEHGSIAVDLFGKAMAYADEFEPREVPPAVELRPELLDAPESLDSAGEASDAPEQTTQQATEAEQALGAEHTLDGAAGTDAVAPGEEITTPGSIDAPAESHAKDPDAVGEAAEAASSHDLDDHEHDHDHDSGETTLTGEAAPGAHGPLPPAPVVPESYPRPEPPSLGQVFRGRVGWISESSHIALVNRDVDRKQVLEHLERYRSERRRVQGLVFGFNRGGFDVLVEGVRAFCPASAMTLEELDEPAQLLGHKLEFLLPASQTVAKDIIVSRRSILERLLRKKAKELVRSLEPGQRIKGRVTQVREFGVFVDIGGIDGLVHQSELSFAHGVKPSDVAAVGDEVEVQVLRVGAEPTRFEGGGRKDRPPRVSLSIKALLPDPWDAHADVLAEAAVRRGKVTRTTDFGAFVELVPQIEGLLHISELGRDLKHANQALSEGDEVCVVVERVDKKARRITLSKLTAQEMADYEAAQAAGAEAPRNVRPGSRIKVVVTRVENRGLVVRVSGVVGKRARGYVPSIELGERAGDLRKTFPVGAEIEVKVVGIDRDGGLRCSPKALAVDEERRAVKDYRREAAKQGFGTFGDLLRAKLGQADPK